MEDNSTGSALGAMAVLVIIPVALLVLGLALRPG